MKKLFVDRLNEEHFEREDGTRFARIYNTYVHYHSNGRLKHVDDFKLVDKEELDNECDDFNIKIKGNKISYKASNKTVNTEILGLYLDDTLLYELSDRRVEGNKVIWKLGDKVDYVLRISPFRISEEIIFKSNPLIGLPIDGKRIYIKYKNTGQIKSKEPWCIDGNNKSVPFFIEDNKKGISVRSLYTSIYPITLDPTVSPNPTSDAYVQLGENGVYTRLENTTLLAMFYAYDACGSPAVTYTRSYIRFNLSSMASYTINSAVLYLYRSGGISGAVIREVLAEVDPETNPTPSTVFNNANGTALGTMNFAIGYNQLVVTNYVNTHKGGFCDFGITREQFNHSSYESFHSSEGVNKPYILIDYTTGGVTPAFIPQVIFI